MEFSRSGYYRWYKGGKSPRRQEYERLRPLVKEIHRKSKESYGARRIPVELTARGEPCGLNKAATLMKEARVAAKQKKKF